MEELLNEKYCGKFIKPGFELDSLPGVEWSDGYCPDELEADELEYDDDDNPLPEWNEYFCELDHRPCVDDPTMSVTTSMTVRISGGVIDEITIGCHVSSSGDSGLGEADPDDVWCMRDVERAAALLDQALASEREIPEIKINTLREQYIGREVKAKSIRHFTDDAVNYVEPSYSEENGCWKIELECIDADECNDEGESQTYYIRFSIMLDEDDIICDLQLDEVEKYYGEDAKATYSEMIDSTDEVIRIVRNCMDDCTKEVDEIPYTFTIDIYLHGGSGNSEIEYAITSKEYALIASAQRHDHHFNEVLALADLYAAVRNAVYEQLSNDIDPDEDLSMDEVDFEIEF